MLRFICFSFFFAALKILKHIVFIMFSKIMFLTQRLMLDLIDKWHLYWTDNPSISTNWYWVWHQGLIHKLLSIGISGSLLHWFSSYLSGRNQRVVLSKSASIFITINAGVPQGSILGPFSSSLMTLSMA